ncbi:hypothetical protein HYC85_017341 [Camellia sinensis]|uniref:Calcineurin B-like protein n=1 Tax=Camellia sinensis TaxID=4442 RepID=A0A7J7H2C2_CAMSI|nr:hypothetical protein HYC85_017341 [Camellia sinensis]
MMSRATVMMSQARRTLAEKNTRLTLAEEAAAHSSTGQYSDQCRVQVCIKRLDLSNHRVGLSLYIRWRQLTDSQKKYPPVLTGCLCSKNTKWTPGYKEPTILAAETTFTVSEVEALYELFKKLSGSVIDDGHIHTIFDLFDMKRNGVIEFGEFVRSLGVFHPNAPVADKIAFAFRLYDLRNTGFIEREEASIAYCIFLVPFPFFTLHCDPGKYRVEKGHLLMLKEMVLALLHESDLILSEDDVEMIVDKVLRKIGMVFSMKNNYIRNMETQVLVNCKKLNVRSEF